ncbi:MAG: hypothetical protein JRH06_10015 [Deltaproteobacteria bacterium]|nr:hypothetical protein [Deltaproteobacteria bacterium]MBW2137879.1 hypothetical protein [Deltaproteobacteria bacterium]
MRLRALILGLVLALAICSIIPFNNIYRQSTPLGGGHFPLAPFFVLVWLTLIAALIGRLRKGRPWLTGKELLVTWVLMVLVSGIAYTGLARTFFVNLTAPYHFASVENRWGEVIHPLLPQALYPQDSSAIEGIYNGIPEGRQIGWIHVLRRIPWNAWFKPLILWGGFVLLCYFAMMCLISLLSKQWLDNERMNLPLLQVPELMGEHLDRGGVGPLLSNRFILAGLLVPVTLHLINGLNFYYPAVPQIPTLILAGPYFPKYGLFSGFHKLKIYIYPAFIGFAFLTSKQISFSFWAFFILGGLLIGFLSILGYNIPAASLGITFGPALSRPEETQMIGAYGVFFFFILWLGRHHLLDVLLQAFGLRKGQYRDSDWFSTRFSFWGFTLGVIGIVIWMHFFGVPLLASFFVVAVFFMVMLVASRVVCQGGVAYFTLTAAPLDGLIAFFGPQFFTNIGILVAGVTQKVLFVDLRESLMPSLVHARKVTDGIKNRCMIIGGISVTLILAVAVSFIAMLALCYKFGIRELQLDWATRTTLSVYENIYSLIENPVSPGHWVLVFSIAGAVVMLILVMCYHRFYWWPIHPIGYLTAYSSAMRILWFSFFLGWLCNALCIRYGGVLLFKRFRLFFVGLIIGDFLMGGIWAIIGLITGVSFQILPG